MVDSALHRAHDAHWLRLVAMLTRRTGSAALAEDAVAAAFEQAVKTWPRDGVPESIFAWLLTAARNRAVDTIRAQQRRDDQAAELARSRAVLEELGHEGSSVDDEVLMMAMCAHPSLSEDSAVATMLRFVTGVPTATLAAAYLTSTSTMAARLTRAKKTLAARRHDVGAGTELDVSAHVPVLLDAVHLAWTLGHTSVTGDALRDVEIARAALRLARVLAEFDRGAEAQALAAIAEFGTARWLSREGGGGQRRLEDMDRDRWNGDLIEAATSRLVPLTEDAGVYRLRAEIERLHCVGAWEDVDWPAVVSVYDRLLERQPDVVVGLGRCVAVSYAASPGAGIRDLDALVSLPQASALRSYPYTYAALADMWSRYGDAEKARAAYARAAELARTSTEQSYFRALSTT